MGRSVLVLGMGLFVTSLANIGEENRFVPASSGETPKCARSGKSFCEYVDNYPTHVIGYLLEQGRFDTNTLFTNEIDVKPPILNKTSGAVDLRSRSLPNLRSYSKSLPVRYPGPSHPPRRPTHLPSGPSHPTQRHPSPVPVYHDKPRQDLNQFVPQFAHQTHPEYRDYRDYYQARNNLHGSAPNSHSSPGDPIFLSDVINRKLNPKAINHHDPAHKDDLPAVKHFESELRTLGDTPYTYKIIDGDAIDSAPAHRHMSSLQLPSRAYLPPPINTEIHNTAPSHKYPPPANQLELPSQTYLPPSDHNLHHRIPKKYYTEKDKQYTPAVEPSQKYLPPLESPKEHFQLIESPTEHISPQEASKEYPSLVESSIDHIPPKNYLEEPSKSYLPPMEPPKTYLEEPSKSYLPPVEPPKEYLEKPSKSYLPPVELPKDYLEQPSKSYLPPIHNSPPVQPAYLESNHGVDEIQLLPHHDALTINLPTNKSPASHHPHPTNGPNHLQPSSDPHHPQPSPSPHHAAPALHFSPSSDVFQSPFPSVTPPHSHPSSTPRYPQTSPFPYYHNSSPTPYPNYPSPTPLQNHPSLKPYYATPTPHPQVNHRSYSTPTPTRPPPYHIPYSPSSRPVNSPLYTSHTYSANEPSQYQFNTIPTARNHFPPQLQSKTPHPPHPHVHQLPRTPNFSIADYYTSTENHSQEQNEVSYSNKAKLQQALKNVKQETKEAAREESVKFQKLQITTEHPPEKERPTTTTTQTTTEEITAGTISASTEPTEKETTTEREISTEPLQSQETTTEPILGNIVPTSGHVRFPESESESKVTLSPPQSAGNVSGTEIESGPQLPAQAPDVDDGLITFVPAFLPKQIDVILQESLVIPARGGKVVRPRSFALGSRANDLQYNSPQGQPHPASDTIHGLLTADKERRVPTKDREHGFVTKIREHRIVTKDRKHRVSKVRNQGLHTKSGQFVNDIEQSVFPKQRGLETFNSDTENSYRLTTPSSHVFVQRNFNFTPSVVERPYKREIVTSRDTDKEIVTEEENREKDAQQDEELEESTYQSLRNAVDVLTRSSLGFVYLPDEEDLANKLQDVAVAEDPVHAVAAQAEINSLTEDQRQLQEELDEVQLELQQELHLLQRQLGGAGDMAAGHLVSELGPDQFPRGRLSQPGGKLDHFPTDNIYHQAELLQPRFEHFPVQNIYDKEAIEQILLNINEEQELGQSTEMVEVIGKEQFDDILLANYLQGSQENNPTRSDIVADDYLDQDVLGSSVSMPRSERQMKLSDTVSEVFSSSDRDGGRSGQSRSLAIHALETGYRDGEGNGVEGGVGAHRIDLVPYNTTVYIPAEDMEYIRVGDSTERNNMAIDSRQDFVASMPAPSLTTKPTNEEKEEEEEEDTKEVNGDDLENLSDQITADDEVEHLYTWGEGPNINLTFQEQWIGHKESPVEVERKKRQLARHRRSLDDVIEEGEQLLDELERDVVTDMMLEQEFDAVLRDEKEQRGEEEEQDRRRRQTTDPDQLCPTVANFVLPRAGVNAQGDWMFIVNMPGETRYQQLVRSEICISENCRGLCAVPHGLITRCSQQFVQKKLVALHPSGDKLVEDMFWFPSCCVCQVTRE